MNICECCGKPVSEGMDSNNIIDHLFTPDTIRSLKDKTDEQSYTLVIKIVHQLRKELTPSTAQQEAINRLLMSMKSGDISLNRNSIFKAAHALGIKLPSSMF